MSRHTPGPWEINERHGGVIYIEGVGNTVAICHDDGFDIDHAEAEANARLIAAAPQVLEALELADELIDQLIIDNTDNYVEERAKIRAAIAAAKGEV